MKYTNELLTMALAGYEAERSKLDGQIAEVRAMLRRDALTRMMAPLKMAAGRDPSPAEAPVGRKMGVEARKAIAKAQRLRWDEWRKAKAKMPGSYLKERMVGGAYQKRRTLGSGRAA